MLISILIILSILLILFRVLRGESISDIHREIKELKKATDVPHYFWKSVKIVFSFKGPGYKRRCKRAESGERRAESGERRAESGERRVESGKRGASD